MCSAADIMTSVTLYSISCCAQSLRIRGAESRQYLPLVRSASIPLQVLCLVQVARHPQSRSTQPDGIQEMLSRMITYLHRVFRQIVAHGIKVVQVIAIHELHQRRGRTVEHFADIRRHFNRQRCLFHPKQMRPLCFLVHGTRPVQGEKIVLRWMCAHISGRDNLVEAYSAP